MISTIGLNIKALKKEPFSGSYHGMRFYLSASEDTLNTWVYPEPWSFEVTPDEQKERKGFAFTQEGLDEAIVWINQRFDEQRTHWEQINKDKMKIVLEA